MGTEDMKGGKLKIALVQMATGANKGLNLSVAAARISAAAKTGAQLVVLPECFNSPYGLSYFPKYAESILPSSPSYSMLSNAAQESQVFLVGGSIPEAATDGSGKLYNTSLVFGPEGSCLGIHRKIHLFDIDVPGGVSFKESAVLSPGSQLTHFDTPWGRIGLGICYDIRFPEMTLLAARKEGVKLMLFPGAFNMTTGPLHWELLLRARALDNQIYVAGCAPARDSKADYVAWGHSAIVDPMGRVVASTDEKDDIIYGVLDSQVVEEARKAIPTSLQRRFDVYPDICAGLSATGKKRARSVTLPEWCPFTDAQQVQKAVALYPQILSRLSQLNQRHKNSLPELDVSFKALQKPTPYPVTSEALEKIIQWKLARGTHRPSLLSLTRSNSSSDVLQITQKASAALTKDSGSWPESLKSLVQLRGVGPATATAILSLWSSSLPFYSDEAGSRVLGLQKLKYTDKEVVQYIQAMQDCAAALDVSARDLETALFVSAHESVL